jgi:FKBP-type peptidyl-prolyl cis-trans isomerase 2
MIALNMGCVANMESSKDTNGSNEVQVSESGDNNSNAKYNNLEEHKKIQVGDNISVNYTGRLEDGKIFDSSVGREPLTFNVGQGEMISGFDKAVAGMKVGEKKTVTLSPEEAYIYRDELKVTYNKEDVPDFEELDINGKVVASNGQQGTIIEKTDSNITIDFNPEVAGKTLIFDIEIVSIN